MKAKIVICLILGGLITIGCDNEPAQPDAVSSVANEATTENTGHMPTPASDASDIDSDKVIAKLQGEWKEPNYPFRTAEFEDSTVKFTEEGTVEAPRFKKFEISGQCPSASGESGQTESAGMFIVMVKDETCQGVKLTADTLVFSGFNNHTNKPYQIIYERLR